MIVKENTKGLHQRLNDLDWTSVPVSHRSVDTGHGRREVRTIQVTDAPVDLGFPHAAQVFLVERYTTRKVRKRVKNSRRYKTVQVKTAVAVLGITSLSAREAAPEHLATYVRGHWSIENRLHWVMSHSVRTPPRSRPGPGPASWPPSVFSELDLYHSEVVCWPVIRDSVRGSS